MPNHGWPTTAEIAEVFAEEVAELGGTVTDRYDDEDRLLARSVIPGLREVGPGDLVQGGVAIRAAEGIIQVHPYVFRQVCRNGAIMAQAVQTWEVARDESPIADPPLRQLREAIRACGSEEAFEDSADQIRSSREINADLGLMVMPMIARLPKEAAAHFLKMIFERFTAEGDDSRFGWMNAITSVARDTRDPEHRWRLETLGGGVPAEVEGPRPTLDPARAELAWA